MKEIDIEKLSQLIALEQQIRPHAQYWDCYNDCSLDYDHTNKLVKITENFAIGFGEYLDSLLEEQIRSFTMKELLEIYKKEKGL